MEQHWFDCQCSDFGHVVRFTLDPDNGTVYLDVRLNPYLPWYRRLWVAVLYLFVRPKAHGGLGQYYDVTLLSPADFGRLHDLLDRAQLQETRRRLAGGSRVAQDKSSPSQ